MGELFLQCVIDIYDLNFIAYLFLEVKNTIDFIFW